LTISVGKGSATPVPCHGTIAGRGSKDCSEGDIARQICVTFFPKPQI
jgi:hypothetical protein